MPEQKQQMQENPVETSTPENKEEKKKPSWILWVALIATLLLIGGAVYYYFFYREKQDTGNGADQTTPVSTEESTTEDEEDEEEETTDGTEEEVSDAYQGWETYTYSASDFEATQGPSHEYEGAITFKYPSEYEIEYGQCSWYFDNEDGEEICYNMGSIDFGLDPLFNTNVAYFSDLALFNLTAEPQAEAFGSLFTEVSSESLSGHKYEITKLEMTTITSESGYEETVYVYKVQADNVGFRFTVAPSRVDQYEDTILLIIDSIEVT